LIVDDDPNVALTLKMVLYENSFKVDSFNNPILALKNFQAGSYDLLIMDVSMPQMNGFELYEKIREIDNKVRIRFLATESEMKFGNSFQLLPNVNCFIKKPIENEKLIIKQVSETIGQEESLVFWY
jgi:two-component SAPR family response regulator